MLKIYRKTSAKRIRLNKGQVERIQKEMELRCRVQRPDIVALFLSGEFHKLPVTAPAIVKNRATRILDYSDNGWIIPESEYDNERYDINPQSMANNVVLWINKNLGNAINADDFAVVVE